MRATRRNLRDLCLRCILYRVCRADFGAMAQLVAHLHGMERVRGSNPLSSTDRVSGDFRKPFFIPKSEIQTSIPIPPVTGENRTQPGTSQSKNLHRVEESSHQQASQHPKTSSHWRKLDATKHLTVQIPPVTGTNDPLRCLPESVLFQRMEESPR